MMRCDFIIECLKHEVGKNLSLLTDITVIHNFSEKQNIRLFLSICVTPGMQSYF